MQARTDLASYWSRVGATLLDGLLIAVVVVIGGMIAGATGAGENATTWLILGAALLSSLLYAPILMCRSGAHNGQTLGKQATSIRAVRADAQPITASTALLREFVGKGLLGLIPFFTLVDYLFPLGDARRQSIHDKLASTFVVRADAVPDHGEGDGAPAGTAGLPPAPGGWVAPGTSTPAPAPAPDARWAPPAATPPAAAAPAPIPPPPSQPAPAPPVADDEAEVRGPFGPSADDR